MKDRQESVANQTRQNSFGGQRGPMAMAGLIEKPKDFSGTMRKLAGYLKAYRLGMLAVFVFAISSTVFAIMTPKILGKATNKVVDGYIQGRVYDSVIAKLPPGFTIQPGTTGAQLFAKLPAEISQKIPPAQRDSILAADFSTRPSIDFAYVAQIAYWLIGLYLLSGLLSYVQGYIMTNISQRVTFHLRRDLSQKIAKLPLSYFDSRTYGEVLSRVSNDIDTVSQTLNQSLSQLITSVTSILGILVMMLTISWQMTLIAVLVLPVSMVFIKFVVGYSQRYFGQQQAALGKLNGHVEEMFSGHTVMKAFNGEAKSIQVFAGINSEMYISGWKSQFISGLLMPIMMFVGNLGYVAVAVLGGWLAIQGKVNIGDIQAFIQYMSQFTQPITQTANIATVLQSTAASAERVFEMLEEEEELPDSENSIERAKVSGAVEFSNVVFGYSEDKTVIHNFTASIQPGQRVAIVGPTGAGKTTIVNLLMRFYDVKKGSITIDGIDIQQWKRQSLRKLFGMVLQDTWLFRGTIYENIAYGTATATEEQIKQAAKAAHADHFIRALPKGYSMELNEEADNISQGEKQLLTIARAMLADAPILILDEATSSVDTRTESLIQKAMEKLMKGRTSFVIAHRLSTIKSADLILVMKDGNIIEQGTHEQLLKQKGFYSSLYTSQFEVNGDE